MAAAAKSIEDYIETRVRDQISYFNKAAAREQGIAKRYQRIQIVAAASTTFFLAWSEMAGPWEDYIRWLSLLSALLTAVAAGILDTGSHFQTGVRYRTAEQMLIRELNLFEQRAGPYDSDAEADIAKTFVKNVEAIIYDDVSQFADQKGGSGGT